jgi:hypothetical protein
MISFLPRRDTKVYTKVHKGLSKWAPQKAGGDYARNNVASANTFSNQ